MPRPIFKRNVLDFIRSSTKVNLAGEMAAVTIYESQKDFLEKNCDCLDCTEYNFHDENSFSSDEFKYKKCKNISEINDILITETKHFEYFKRLSKEAGISPSIFMSLWFSLSKFCAISSMKLSGRIWKQYYLGSIFATFHVEKIIKLHYKEQLDILKQLMNNNISYLNGLTVESNRYNLSNKDAFELNIENFAKHIEEFLTDEEKHFLESNHVTQNYSSFIELIWYKTLSLGCILAIKLSKKF